MTNLTALLLQTPIPPIPGFIPPEAVSIVKAFFVTIAVIALGIPIIRAFTRRFVDRSAVVQPISADVQGRLERIEHAVETMAQAVDTVAIEVERISESQRYLAKLIGEARALPSTGDAPTLNKDSIG
jgi:hypothetical protein